MPKNTSTAILKRWQDMDYQLSRGQLPRDGCQGLSIDRFARTWKVTEKTVRRDLDAFRELGKHSQHKAFPIEIGLRETRHFYSPGVEPLFTRTRDAQKAGGKPMKGENHA